MTFQEFKKAAKKSGFAFNRFTDCTSFLGCYCAEVCSKSKNYAALYYPNKDGGATLVTVFPGCPDRKIRFYKSIEEISI